MRSPFLPFTRWYNACMKPERLPFEDRVNPRMLKSEPLRRCNLDDCHGACCVFGVWVDTREVTHILNNASLIAPSMPEDSKNPGEWFVPVEDDDKNSPTGRVIHTAVENRPDHYEGTACVFWRSDAKCALQVAAVENGFHPWQFKPYYCLLHPLEQDEQGRITLDKTADLLAEQGSCVQPTIEAIPLVETFEQELQYLLGEKLFAQLKAEVDRRAHQDGN